MMLRDCAVALGPYTRRDGKYGKIGMAAARTMEGSKLALKQ